MKTDRQVLYFCINRRVGSALLRSPLASVLGAVGLLLLGFGIAAAQVTASGAIGGTIRDNNQAVISNASVTITNKATRSSRTTTTNDSGEYKIDLLPAGRYDVKISASGFGDVAAENVEVLVGKTSTFDVTMNPGVQTANVTVTAGETELVSKEKTDISLNITPRDVQDLPLNGRDLANLAYLAPGAKPVGSYDPTKNRMAIFGINGSSGRNVNVTVNGIDNKDNTVGGPVMQFPLEAIQEFIISTQRFSAANGRSEGAAVNVVTKSGGSEYHGSGFFFLRDKKLNANEFFSKQANLEKPPFNRKQWGGSIGGPLYLPHFGEGGPTHYDLGHNTFFFFALERQNEATSNPVAGDALTELRLVESLGAQPSEVIPTPYRDWRVNARIDHSFNSRHNIFVSYSDQSNIGLNDQSGQRNDLTAGNFTKNRLLLANVTLNSVLSPRVVNAATVGYQYWDNLIDTEKLVPTFVFGGGAQTITFGTNTNVPQQSYQAKYQFKDDLSITRGVHTFRTGVDYLWEPKLGGFFEFNPTLEIDFLDLPSAILANPARYPNGFASPGAVTGMSATAGDPYFNLPGGAKMFGVYFQDDWKARRNLTLNLGMRWDKDFNLIGTKAQGQSRTFLALKAIGHPAARSLPHDDNRNFSPRVGFAWDLFSNGKHVVRGGYGLYFGQTFLNIPLFMIQQANPTIFAGVFAISSAGPGDATADIVPGTGIRLSNWRFGVDPLPTIPPASTALGAGATGRIMDPDYRNPFTQQWNLGYSFQLNSYSVIEIEFTHVLALHESKTININPQQRLINESSARPLTAAFVAKGLPPLGRIDLEISAGRARYDGLNISYHRRLRRNFTLNANYTLSRALAYNGNAAAFRNRAFNPFDYFASYDLGPTPVDSRHRASLSAVINLPAGFQVAPVMQIESARAYTAGYGGSFDVLGVGSGRGTSHVIVFNDRPQDLFATANAFGGTTSLYRNCLRAGQCSILPFGNLRGQAFFQLDTRVSKTFKIKERAKLTVLFQAFDLTNRANFGNNFGNNVRDSAGFGKPTGFITPGGVIVPHSFSGEVGVRLTF